MQLKRACNLLKKKSIRHIVAAKLYTLEDGMYLMTDSYLGITLRNISSKHINEKLLHIKTWR